MSKPIVSFANALIETVQQRMFGVAGVTRLSLVALYTGGHILLEGNPGLGKTELVKSLALALRFPFGRIQFTPDLMPADITGTYMPDPKGSGSGLVFRPGPVFTSLLLADEINRATPKTQSAMLEAMAEKQVTVLGEIRKLDEPFMVLATQNPIDQEGTYNLPEAQADRFMFKVLMPSPSAETLRRILGKTSGALADALDPNQEAGSAQLLPNDRDDSLRKYQEIRRRIEAMVPLPSLESHIVNMYLASNGRFGELEGLDKAQVERLRRLAGELFTYGLGPRAGTALMLGSKGYSLLFGGTAYAEGPALAEVVLPVLRHRIKLELDWDERYKTMIQTPLADPNALWEKLLADFCLACAPKAGEYQTTVRNAAPLRGLVQGERW